MGYNPRLDTIENLGRGIAFIAWYCREPGITGIGFIDAPSIKDRVPGLKVLSHGNSHVDGTILCCVL
jgi:hypothetical protein